VRDHKPGEREIIFQTRLRENAERQAANAVLVTQPTGGNPPGGPPDRYVLRKEVVGWSLVFDGDNATLPDWKGTAYAAHLLVNAPGEWVSMGRNWAGGPVAMP
jgi:hypothetical protein